MTKLELTKRIGRLLPDTYELDFLLSGEVKLMRITSYTTHGAKYVIRDCLETWSSVSGFLFGVRDRQLSFFDAIDRFKCISKTRIKQYGTPHILEELDAISEIYAFCPELAALGGCSSASELELKLAITGI